MYLYVPNASIRHIINDRRSYIWSGSQQLSWVARKRIATEWLHTNNPMYGETLCLNYLKGFKFYSPQKLQHIPVHGYLLPVAMFEETKVE